jgi:cation:H+ antiporter
LFVEFLLATLGIALLVGGASLLVTGSSKLADLLGVPPVLIGLTVVAWGTSAPELVVALTAAFKGSPGIVLGNVIGSNLANTGLILAVAALLMTPKVERRLWSFDAPVMIGATLLFVFLLSDGTLCRLDGGILLSLFGVITFLTVRSAVNRPRDIEAPDALGSPAKGIVVNTLMAFFGAILLVAGGKVLVDAATGVAVSLGVSDTVIGMTLVAVGTSLPEMAATLVAAARRESGIAMGNVLGSNIFNLLAVTGPAALVRPIALGGSGLWQETGGLIVITLVLPMLLIGRERLSRVGGLVLLLLYAVFIIRRVAG